MKQLRRLDMPPPSDAYRRLQRGVLRYVALSEEEFRTLEGERPGLVIVDGDALLIGRPRRLRIDLEYTFPDVDSFARRFPDMFQRLLAAVRQDEAPVGVRFRLTYRSSRAYLEPVLFANAFELSREWMEMALHELPDTGPPADAIAPGYRLRPAKPDDGNAIAAVDELSFPLHIITPDVARDLVVQAAVLRVLEDSSTGHAVGFLHLDVRGRGLGYIATIAVHPDLQRRGLGEAMLRWALAWFGQQGLRRAALTVSVDNVPAVALYRKLGFAPAEVGLDYRRPLDEDEVRQVLEKHQAVHIRVRRRY